MDIRPEGTKDYGAIQHIHDHAFGSAEESALVHTLRQHPLFLPELSLVASVEGKLVGHILLFPVIIKNKHQKHPALALAPMAVLPAHQNEGIGSALTQHATEAARAVGYTAIVVLGYPQYYPRFGFKPAASFNIFPPAREWSSAFFVLELTDGALADVSGVVQYPPEFGI